MVLGEQDIDHLSSDPVGTTIIYDSELYTNPPLGYTSVDSSQPVEIVAGTWVQGVN